MNSKIQLTKLNFIQKRSKHESVIQTFLSNCGSESAISKRGWEQISVLKQFGFQEIASILSDIQY
jgi:hypothetical protein